VLTLDWTQEALDDLDQLAEYIGERNPAAGARLIEKLEACAERLCQFPFMHRSGRAPATREAVVTPNYLLIYRVTADTVEILSVVHTRQQYP
jgi:toxin ParE1/3/4